ncbi:class I adenylate cyclase [Pseudomonas sp. NCCP-436]|uniref:class I adenylate cyclase n=1 Tax=Pseudomonas sp. NCCP-436 TaxID=2842481 RepID=UPI001C7EC35C|nr:class I adenylate cyclase [Pseudomonas sp. NCCP-436]GIZ10858.1 adenylate cyclase [Pseudomonas sp. NCCP-436]
MTRMQEIRPDIDDGIDRKVLAQLRSRFLRINQGRLERTLQALSPRQQLVLRLLPLLLHVNHPLLPGYVSATTPAGLSGFEPDDDSLAEIQRLARSFAYKPRRGQGAAPLHGLFLMGSLGTIAQAEQSDMDLWLCHSTNLTAQALQELNRKCRLLEEWATTQGAEAHIFLIDPQRFVQGERAATLSSDDCGTTQHYLLLDEFYRTAIWLAGRTPIWWLVPVYEESRYEEYCRTLLNKRFVREEDVLDLGHLAHIPPQEFLGAGLWQLYKGIESPYKSALKLLLTEVYASEYPRVECLALRFKQAVYQGRLDLDELDPYIMVYRRLEDYLGARGDHERLELVRRCLYLKVNKKISRPPARGRQKSWQRVLLERLTGDWGWPLRQLAVLDSRSQWKVRQVSAERRVLVNELNYSYRFLGQFTRNAGISSLPNNRDLAVLGRRLYAAFERRAGKVEFTNPGIAPDLAEDTLTLVHQTSTEIPEENHWALFGGSLGAQDWPDFAPIRRSRELIELLAWCHRNGVIDASTRLSLHPGVSDLNEFELTNLIASLQQCFPLPLPPMDDTALLRASQPTRILLLINVGVDPLRQHSQMNLHMTTGRTDALGYSGMRENLVLTLDQVSLNSWNELLVSRHDGEDALLDCLSELLNQLPPGTPIDIRVRCFCRNRAKAIAERVEELLRGLLDCYSSGIHSRYVLQIRQHYHVLYLKPGQVRHVALGDLQALLDHLGTEQKDYSPLRLDRYALHDTDLALILPMARPQAIQVFYRLNEAQDEAELTVIDEYNALWRRRVPFRDEQSLLTPLQRFLQSLLYRRNAQLPLDGTAAAAPLEVLYYQILPDAPLRPRSIEPRPAPQACAGQPFYEVQAIIKAGEGRQRQVTLYCNHREFSELEHGQALYARVARHILAHRRNNERYPCYITDLDLSALTGKRPPSTVRYLRYKASLEDALNQALRTP